MDWRKLFLAQHFALTSKERVTARKLCDNERGRLAELDRLNGSKLLYAWTMEFGIMPNEIDDNVPVPTNEGWAVFNELVPIDAIMGEGKPEGYETQPPETAPVAPEKPKRGRKPKGVAKEPAQASQAEALEAALTFVSPVENNLNDFSEFVNLVGGSAVMYNGQFAAGHPIEEALSVAAHLSKLRAALKRCGKSLAITETEAGQLAIKGDKLRAIVPCVEPESLAQMQPDQPLMTGDFEVLKESFKICGVLAKEAGTRVVEASLLLEANTCTGTDGAVMLQHWHGIAGLPPAIVLPKLFTQSVAACPKKITGLGGYWDGEKMGSFTVWFEDGAWMKTQCYNDRWPDISGLLDVPSQPVPVPAGLFEAVEAVKEFIEGEAKAVFLKNGMVMSHGSTEVGAQYIVPDLVVEKKFNHEFLKRISPYAETMDFSTYDDRSHFFGGSCRGVIMCIRA